MAGTALAPSKPKALDDIMIAMDVVDTLRHRDDLVRRELSDEARESELIARLRQVYRDQGIEVPDQVLADGVKALNDSRFVYTPPPASWKRTLLTLWTKQKMHGKRRQRLHTKWLDPADVDRTADPGVDRKRDRQTA